MKNNRGITLVELIISIALISVVIVFLFNLLAEVRHVNSNTDFNRKNQQKRAIIMKTIREDFLERGLVGLKDVTNNSVLFSVELTYKDGTKGTIIINNEGDKQFISYTNGDGFEKWYLEKQNNTTHYNTTCITYNTSLGNPSVDTGEYFFMKFRIPIVVKQDSPNNIDDLEFTYIGLKSEVNQADFVNYTKKNLGKYNHDSCN